ncbi:MAG: TetR/AcrR family transcriptional regulator [Spirochaetaceae bacterium]|nr:TetR/AcrR family transcriptional regulator [Spirochaetaceae bacterium]
MPRAFSDHEKGLIRQRLVQAGRKLLNTVGIKALTIDELARMARISKGSFYAFFSSREDLILSVFESWEDEYRGPLLELVLTGSGDAQLRLKRFFSEALRLVEREPALARLGSGEIQYIVERLPQERIAAHQAADRSVLTEAFGRWVDAGIIAREDLPALIGSVQFIFLLAMHKDEMVAGTFESTADLLVDALAARFAAGGRRGGV